MSRTPANLQIDIVRLEDKENKLKAFIQSLRCVTSPAPKSGGTDDPVLLVARSASSPVAKAIVALAREGVLSMPVRAVFLLDKHDGGEGSLYMARDLPLPLSVRIASDLRLSDAHEQLVIGPASSWFGDCMRRDPMKRDAYECFAADCLKTAAWARISFERLWASSKPVTLATVSPAPISNENCQANAAAEAALAAEANPEDTPYTRQG